MKKKIVLISALSLFIFSNVKAQVPSNYTKGSVMLADGTSMNGYIFDNLKKKGSISFLNEKGEGKKSYNADNLNGITIDSTKYIAINGDFFRVICDGRISFLQKASACSKMIYNGTDAAQMPNTAGKTGDYFFYSNKKLSIVNKNNMDELVKAQFAGATAAIEKASSVNGDIAALAEAVAIYNNLNK